MKLSKGLIACCVVLSALVAESPIVYGSETSSGVEQSSKGRKRSNSGNRGAAQKSNAKNTGKSNSAKRQPAKTAKKPETAADLQKQHEAARKEIKLTEEQIRANEAKIKKSLGDLNRINSEIATTRVKVSDMTAQVNKLNNEIASLESQIKGNEESLALMRSEYLKAVKKMRQSRQNQSMLAFIFASENFNQALRRMRYLRQFSNWKEKQSAEINKKVELLKRQTALLEQTRSDKDKVLQAQVAAQQTLEKQGKQQDALVVELRRNGDALRSHLSKKQSEANVLKNRVAALIAEEQRKAAAEKAAREAREAEARRKEEARIQAEREAAEKAAKEQAEKEKANKDNKVSQDKGKKEQPKKEQPKKGSDKGKDYADARKRKPRNESTSASSISTASKSKEPATAPSPAKPSGGNFAAMRGALPRPVDGSWRVTSRFGRHALPDLPDVMYDNPGIDAEVSRGATAKAVYGGKVTGVYMIPGFGTVIIVNHGDYFTVYGNLASVNVKSGDNVHQGQSIGKVGEDPDDPGHSSIHFEVWKNREKLNPQEWIR